LSESAKSLRIERIANGDARRWLQRRHPLGAGAGVKLAFGLFWAGKIEGVITLGAPGTNQAGRSIGCKQHEILELRKMFVTDVPPRNSESRALAVVARVLKSRYPSLRALVTYCDSEEAASAYKASGWVKGATHKYTRDYLVGGEWMSVRHANRLGLRKQASEVKTVSRTKWVYPIDPKVAALVQG
jgi:hypothetical protein